MLLLLSLGVAAQAPRVLIIAVHRAPLTLPAWSWDAALTPVLTQLHDPLLRRAANGSLTGILADAWVPEDGARTWRFHLRRAVPCAFPAEPLAAMLDHPTVEITGQDVRIRVASPDYDLPAKLAHPALGCADGAYHLDDWMAARLVLSGPLRVIFDFVGEAPLSHPDFSRFDIICGVIGGEREATHRISLHEGTLLYVAINCVHPPLTRLAVRRALNQAVPRKRLGLALLAGSPLPPGVDARDDSLRWYAWQPASARRVLSQLNMEWTFIYPTGSTPRALIEGLLQAWQIAGAHVRAIGLARPEYEKRLASGDYDLALCEATDQNGDADTFMTLAWDRQNAGHTNHAFYRSDRFHALLAQARRASEPQPRVALWKQAQRLLVQDAPIVALGYSDQEAALSPQLKTVRCIAPGVLQF